MVNQWLQNTLYRWLPQACCLCGKSSATQAICPACLADLPRFSPQSCCPQCGRPAAPGGVPCGHCQRTNPAFDRTRTVLAYAPPVSELVSQLKFQGRIQLARLLGEILASQIQQTDTTVQTLIPVPLHPRRLRQRGFNQAVEIARPVSRECALPIEYGCLERHRHTEPQSAQPAHARHGNVRGAFRLRHSIKAESVAIVDDVMTSGHTVNAVAGLLRAAGVKHIEVWCVARAWPHPD